MEAAADRLQRARKKAGYDSPTDAARAFGFPISTYLSHENGTRGLRVEAATRYARAYKVNASWLLTGRGDPNDQPQIPVVGYVGAGAEIFAIDDYAQGGGLEYVEAPPDAGPDTVAVRVRGESMWPAYQDRDVLVYDQLQFDAGTLIGREAVVRLVDGRTLVKYLTPGSGPGLFTLVSYNAPPITDVAAEWAAPVGWIKRAPPAMTPRLIRHS